MCSIGSFVNIIFILAVSIIVLAVLRVFFSIGTSVARTGASTLPISKGVSVIDHSMTTTAFNLDGFQVVLNKGLVRGITVRSRSIVGTLGGSLQTILGGNITLFTSLCEKTRQEAFEMMLQHAQEMGANAVIGVRYDANEVMQGVTEVLCYGTAVVVKPS